MKKLLVILALACMSLTFFAVGCGGAHTQHTFGDWVDNGDSHERTCTFNGCEEKESAEHTFGEWENVGNMHERTCTALGCGAKESGVHTFGEWTNTEDGHERTCTVDGCNAMESTSHIFGECENIGDKHQAVCQIKGCDKKEEATHVYGDWVDAGKQHKKTCKASGCDSIIYENHNFSTEITTINGVDFYECLTDGCDGLMEVHEHRFGGWVDNGDSHVRVCEQENCSEKESAQHEYTADYGAFIEDGQTIKFVANCKYCKKISSQDVIYSNVVVVTPENAETVFASIESNQALYFAEGDYSKLTIENAVNNVVIGGSEKAFVERITIAGQCSNIKFIGINFDGDAQEDGVNLKNEISKVLVYGCSFEGGSQVYSNYFDSNHVHLIRNVKVEKCYFNITAQNTSAINISKIENFTLTDCHVEYVAYNVIQIGHLILAGDINITNNVFESAYSRMIYLVGGGAVTLGKCEISGNYFGRNEDCNKETGVYLMVGCADNITVGVNSWASVPENDDFYFYGNIDYVEEDQLIWQE
jgi:hypothetical protein